MKAILNLRTVNKSGGPSVFNEDIGRSSTQIEGLSNGSISVDAFEGSGKDYKRREDAVIDIYFGGKLEFEGTLQELINKIKS